MILRGDSSIADSCGTINILMQGKKSIIIGTAGHIDHGKTALVKALTGVDTDRLPEEKARGITIDLGFAHWDLGDVAVSFVDVPGHERFVRNMLAGIAGVDLLMLIVAADESVMPQTREHFDICRLLGIPAGMVVLTKIDLVDGETVALVKDDIATLVAGSFLQDAPVYAVSARTGEGLDSLKEGIQSRMKTMEQRRPSGIVRLPVDRVFTLKGHGTVVTGTLVSGRLRKDQPLEILPSGKRTRVRSIHAHDQNVEEAVAGQRTAVNLLSLEKEEVTRGDVLTEPDVLKSISLLDVKLILLPGSRPLAHNALVRLHHQANDLLARVTLLGTGMLQPGAEGFAQLRLQRPLLALFGDRFILRRQSPPVTIGGGVILDHFPQKRVRSSDASALQRLQKLEHATMEERYSIAVEKKGIIGASEPYLRASLAIDLQSLRKLRAPEVVLLQEQPQLALSAPAFSRIQQRLKETVAAFHEKQPLLPGIQKEELRTKFFAPVPTEVFLACLQRAVDAEILHVDKDVVSLAGRTVSLSSQQETLLSVVEAALLQSRLEFPGFEELAKRASRGPDEIKKLMYLLVRRQRAVKLSDDYFVSRSVWEELKARIRDLKTAKKSVSVPDFKDMFGVSRKYAIPLLEQLDRDGITRRVGNERIIL